MITSAKNDRIKDVIELNKKRKARDEAGLFTVEGVRMVSELPRERTEILYVSESFIEANGPYLSDSEKDAGPGGEAVPYEIVSDSVFNAMSDTRSPQGVLALVRQYEYTPDDIIKDDDETVLLILEDIQDPGNLGTMLRAGEAAGIDGVIMSAGTADIYNPKVVRSTMGSIFRVPFMYADSLDAVIKDIRSREVRIYAADASGEKVYDQADLRGRSAFLIGNEGNGLTKETLALADERVRIPMAGKVESLNAAIAASILMFEAARQRRNYGDGN